MRKIIFILMLILLSSFCYGALSDGLRDYWSFDVDCNTNDHNASNPFETGAGTPLSYGGIEGTGCGSDGDDWIKTTNVISSTMTETYNYWVNTSTSHGYTPTIWDLASWGFGTIEWYGYSILASTKLVSMTASDGVGALTPFTSPANSINNNKWYMITLVLNETGGAIYINGSINTDNYDFGGSRFLVAGGKMQWLAQNTDVMTGTVDEIARWGRALTPDEISTLYNSGAGYFYSDITGGGDSPLLDIQLWNSANVSYTTIDENDDFYPVVNWTLSGTPLNNGECSINITNATAHFSYASASNLTLSNNQDTLTLNFTESQQDIQDILEFTVCQGSIEGDLDIKFNGTTVKTLNSEIPDCNLGTHTEIFNTTAYLNNNTLNISLVCADCNNPNEEFKIVVEDEGLIHFERQGNLYSEDLTEKGDIYIYDTHFLHLHDTSTINATCNTTVQGERFEVTDVNLTIDILSIGSTAFVDNMQIEANDSYSILIDITGDIVANIDFNLTFWNGTLIKNSITEVLTFINNDTFGDGIYNISISATDDEDITTFKTGYFNYNDTTTGSFTWTYPLITNTSTQSVNNTVNLNITFSDVNLFAYECLVYEPDDDLIYNFTDTGLTGSSYTLTQSFNINETGNYTVTCVQSDDHTLKVQPEIPVKIKDRTLNYTIMLLDGYKPIYKDVLIEYKGLYTMENVVSNLSYDRYSWTYDFYLGTDKFNKYVDHRFFLKCEDSYYIDSTEDYPHFVCWSARQWVDFNSNELQSFNVYSCGVDCWDVRVRMNPDEKVTFRSIGGLNQITQSASFEAQASGDVAVTEERLNFTGVCPTDSLANTIMFIFLFIVGFGMMFAFKFWVRMPGLTIIVALFVSLFFGLAMMNCSAILGSMIIIFGLIFAIAEFMS